MAPPLYVALHLIPSIYSSGYSLLTSCQQKPVSSLRSHFEQMANSKPSSPAPRPLSPNPANRLAGAGDPTKTFAAREEMVTAVADGLRAARGRDRDATDRTLLQPQRNDSADLSPSPTRFRPRPLSAMTPAVTIQPPLSPEKTMTLNLAVSNPSTLLSDNPKPSGPGTSSPRHFKIPSRPHTPLLEPGRKSPTSSQPPSPPPPRRSGELKRNSSFKGTPPPVNRAEKPKIASKPLSLRVETPPIINPRDRTSPFSTPPGSDSSPEYGMLAPALPPNRPRMSVDFSSTGPRTFDPPPIHHMVVSKRRDQESHSLGRGLISPQVTGDGRPALPSRPQSVILKPRQPPQNAMLPPPPPRPSMDRARPTRPQTPPKRVVSSPTNAQLQAPPKSHGRSMTVDRAIERIPGEFRTPISSSISYTESGKSMDAAPSSTYIKNALSQRPVEYPDSSYSNRRPPCFKQGAQEIATKYETRIHDVCGEFVCTSGHMTRVWSLLDGEIIMSLAHTEGVRIMSVAFKPASSINEEGSRLWLGTNVGDILEVDVAAQSIVATKANAHTRRDIIKIHRHKNEMWTLDDGGTLHLWAPDSTGSPSLSNPYQSFRVPKGHTFSMVVGDKLWHAAGKEVRVFEPTLDGSEQFQILQRPMSQPNAGEVTSGAAISTQPDRVYFGHVDGKVSIYSSHDYSCLGVVSISQYKVTSLTGIGGHLWAGFSNGMIYVYDTTTTPWIVKKDWRAHHDPLITMSADRSSFWSLDRAHVISLGQDNMIRVWDGLLQEDWIGMAIGVSRFFRADTGTENQMQSQEAEFCELKPIKALVMTWNAGASTPYHLQHSKQDSSFFRDLMQNSDCPDLLVFGFQELVDLEDKKTTASMCNSEFHLCNANFYLESFFKSKKKDPSEPEHMSHQYRDWRDFLTRCLDDYMPGNELYHLLHTSSLVGLFTCIFVKASLRERIKSISGAEVKRGMGGLHGNKV